MSLLRAGSPLAHWPGLPFGRRQVLVPVDAQGELWGARDHEELFIAVRWPHEPTFGPPSITWTTLTLAEACRRLPEGAILGVGLRGVPVSCAATSLDRVPDALDLTGRVRQVRDLDVVRLDDDDRFTSIARHQGASAAYRLVARRAGLLLLAVRDREVREASARHFGDDCGLGRVADPAELWQREDLPRRLRKRLDALDQEGT